MLRSNLATRPFYNERAAHVAIGIAAVLVLAITVLNVVQVVRLSKHSTELSSQTGVERTEAERLTAEAARIRSSINKDELALIVGAAHEANSLIDQRTFSWTAFFNRIESTLPPDVMLTSVRPSIKDGETHVAIGVLGRRAEDVDEFMEKLEATGAFSEIVPASQDRTEERLYRVSIESVYDGAGDAAAAAAEKPQATGGRK
ncbi:MAG TPA: PilN domain-containing protein [Vicinamibacterales bacterium]|nr:PilN domain-containing protein [Vicinamibacterales bacterium]